MKKNLEAIKKMSDCFFESDGKLIYELSAHPLYNSKAIISDYEAITIFGDEEDERLDRLVRVTLKVESCNRNANVVYLGERAIEEHHFAFGLMRKWTGKVVFDEIEPDKVMDLISFLESVTLIEVSKPE